jgi:hypothetical protein
MKALTHKPILLLSLTLLTAALVGCQCTDGQRVTIPATDATAPEVVMDLHLPNGNIVTVTSASVTPTIVNVPGGGEVTIIAAAEDPEGVKDAQIWAASFTTTINPNGTLGQTANPGLLTFPTASNNDSGTTGKDGCTRRLVTHKVKVSRTPTRLNSFEVHAEAVNFGNQKASTALAHLIAQ